MLPVSTPQVSESAHPQSILSPEVLLASEDLYLRVPVLYGQVLSKENIATTCSSAGFKPLCRYNPGNQGPDSLVEECSLGGLEGRWDNAMKLNKHISPGIDETKPFDCSILDGVFFWKGNESTEAYGILKSNIKGDSSIYAPGSRYTSGEDSRPLYAACIKEGGRWHRSYLTTSCSSCFREVRSDSSAGGPWVRDDRLQHPGDLLGGRPGSCLQEHQNR